jgi:hypothetical protein
MVTIPEAVENIIKKSLFLEEALSIGIINISALARSIKPKVEREVMKEVQEGAIIMALNRFSQKLRKKAGEQEKIFRSTPDLMVRSNLIEITYSNSELLVQKQKKLLDQLSGKQYFLTLTQGINETTIIASKELEAKILKIFKEEKIISRIDNLSSITVLLPLGTASIPGAYNYILKSLAWEGINVVEVVSTFNELTIILEDKNIDFSFSILKRLF